MPSTTAMLLLVLAASGDPETPKGDCSEFVSQYRKLLQERAKDEVTEPKKGSKTPPVVLQAQAEEHAGRVFEAEAGEVRAACDRADRSQYECVVDASTYDDLAACRAPALPLVRDGVKVTDVKPLERPRERDPAALMRQFVVEGKIDVKPQRTEREVATPPLPTAKK